MNTAFEITADDVSTVLNQKFMENQGEDTCQRILDTHIAPDRVEREALWGNDLEEQTDYAYQEIHRQLQEKWEDVKNLLKA